VEIGGEVINQCIHEGRRLIWCVCFVSGMWYGMCKVQRDRTRGGRRQPGSQRGRALVEVKDGVVCLL
jgi:hypothetical protein